MKRLIVVAEEIDGHSASYGIVTTTQKAFEEALHSLLYYEDKLIYEFSGENKEADNIITQYYQGDLGELSITVICFNAYKEIENKFYYSRTG